MQYFKNSDILEKQVEESIFVYNMDNDKCYQMEETSKIIWENIDNKNIEEVIEQISKEFKVDKNVVENDVHSFVEELLNNELIYKG